jgi:uncharacterized membrane protein
LTREKRGTVIDGAFKKDCMNALAIRNELRNNDSEIMDKRRAIIWLSALGLVDFSVISLYQTGVIEKLPDLPFKIFDSNKVNASKEAYQFGVPDGPVSAAVYATTIVLAAAGGSEQSGRKPMLDTLLGATIAGNTAGAIYYLYDMIFKQKKICLYCLTGAAINIASAVIVAPLVKRSITQLFRKR